MFTDGREKLIINIACIYANDAPDVTSESMEVSGGNLIRAVARCAALNPVCVCIVAGEFKVHRYRNEGPRARVHLRAAIISARNPLRFWSGCGERSKERTKTEHLGATNDLSD